MGYSLDVQRTDRGRRIVLGRTVAAPAADAWSVLADVRRWREWGPPVTAVEYDATTVVAGTAGRVRAFGLVWIPFRVERVADRCWTWTVGGLTPPADGHRVEALGGDSCRVGLELPLWAPWYLPICVLALRNVAGLLET